ncbi:MAG: GC-type dockerin domain-anchored protein [Phycisphaerales bacterium JB040]
MKFAAAAALLVAGAAAAPALAQETVYAVDIDHLLIVDPDTAASTVVGAHGLPARALGNGRYIGAFSMTYNRETDQLLGLYYSYNAVSDAYDQYLVEYDKQTGAATLLELLAMSDLDGFVESIEYVDGLGSVIVSQDLDGNNTTSLAVLNPDGSRSELTDNGQDNDYAVYDQTRSRFYTTDPNGTGVLTLVDLNTGANTPLGAIQSSLGDLAYSAERDEILALNAGSGELVSLGNGLSAQSPVSIGYAGPAWVLQGLAVATDDTPVPCPADLDNDGDVDYHDFCRFIIAYWFRRPAADINGNGRVNYHDLYAFLRIFAAGGCSNSDRISHAGTGYSMGLMD